MKLPLKTRILQYAIQRNSEFCLEDVLNDLADEYAGERIFNRKQIEEYFDSFLGVEFFRATRMEFDKKGELVIYCTVTDYGKEREKYMK